MTDQIFEIGKAGLDANDQRVKKLMDNLVNAEVPGYKKSEISTIGFPTELNRAMQKTSPMVPQVEASYYSDEPGTLISTGGKLDLALGGEGFFVLAGPWGEGYTRDGRFHLDNEGRLLSVSGNFPVLGKAGPIIVTPGAQVEFTQTGEIRVDGVVMDQIRVIRPEHKNTFETLNGSIFKKKDIFTVVQEVDSPRVIQGFIESSNTRVTDQYLEMIALEKSTNILSKVISTHDNTLSKALELGQVSQ